MHGLEEVSQKIGEISEDGVRIAIDDFGTGYSSLAWLRELPVHQLKIDRLFVQDLVPGRQSRLVEAIISIGQHLGLEVIAEGVETQHQRIVLGELGCDGYQGFLYSPALSVQEFRNWLVTRTETPGTSDWFPLLRNPQL